VKKLFLFGNGFFVSILQIDQIIMLESIIQWLEQHQQACPIKEHLGIICLGCGMQTSFIELLKGNFYESIIAYPPLIPMILLFVFLLAQIKIKHKHGVSFLIFWFVFTVILTISNYIYKLI
jgi:hypothetical protein